MLIPLLNKEVNIINIRQFRRINVDNITYFGGVYDLSTFVSVTRIPFMSQSKDGLNPVSKQSSSYVLEQKIHKDKFLWTNCI